MSRRLFRFLCEVQYISGNVWVLVILGHSHRGEQSACISPDHIAASGLALVTSGRSPQTTLRRALCGQLLLILWVSASVSLVQKHPDHDPLSYSTPNIGLCPVVLFVTSLCFVTV